jgi:hypothetical protein
MKRLEMGAFLKVIVGATSLLAMIGFALLVNQK